MIVVYWVIGGIYTILDITNRPAALRRYKIQPGTNEPVDKRELCKVIAQVLFNQIVVGFPIMYLGYYFMEWRGYPPVRELPTFHWVLTEIAIHILCEEIGFYYSHRYFLSKNQRNYIILISINNMINLLSEWPSILSTIGSNVWLKHVNKN